METKKIQIGYKVLENCTLDYTNYEADEVIIIADECGGNNWKGTEFFDSHPSIFQPIYDVSDLLWNEVGAIMNGCENFEIYPHILEELKEKFSIIANEQ